MPALLDPLLTRTYELDRLYLSQTQTPIVTIAGTYREDLKRLFGLPDQELLPDVVLSRAHFSMATGLAITAWGDQLDHHKAWLIDPTNYVTQKQWKNIVFTETVGKTLARSSLLKIVKDLIDQFGRQKLPILDSITTPLLYLTETTQMPIISFHIAAGNILAEQGRKVIQVVTDPHVRPEYTTFARLPNMKFCVFDEKTKLEFLEVAAIHGNPAHPDRIIVTGPPVDPRIIAARHKKHAWRNGPLQLCIATGGLGTNKSEIRRILQQILPTLRRRPSPYRILLYAGTQQDFVDMTLELAREHRIPLGEPTDPTAPLRILYHPQILDANELLIRYGFPWADGFLTKPSGDMAYDAAAAGCFLLTLKEWGVWEERIREIFTDKDIARRAESEHILEQLEVLTTPVNGHLWVEHAMNKALSLEKLFLLGNQKILKVQREWREQS